MKIIIEDNFLQKQECNLVINFYKKNLNRVKSFRDVFPLDLEQEDKDIYFIIKKLNKFVEKLNHTIDWIQIVKWPVKSIQNLHFDNTSSFTTFSSILYLNDDFEGGQTFFEDGTIVKPVVGRALFFDGNFYKHGVKKVDKNTRYVIATWYKKLKEI